MKSRLEIIQERFEERYSICKECPHHIKLTDQCSKCGCFLRLKALFKDQKCPIGKW